MQLEKRSGDRSVVERPWSVVDRFFDEMWRDPFRSFLRTPSLFEMNDSTLLPWHPSADIEETSDTYVVRMDLPGITKKDIHLNISDNVLTIRGERRREGSEKNDDFRVLERFHGRFERSFVLPKGVDHNSIEAQFKDGVLTINIKKSLEARPKEITIR